MHQWQRVGVRLRTQADGSTFISNGWLQQSHRTDRWRKTPGTPLQTSDWCASLLPINRLRNESPGPPTCQGSWELLSAGRPFLVITPPRGGGGESWVTGPPSRQYKWGNNSWPMLNASQEKLRRLWVPLVRGPVSC